MALNKKAIQEVLLKTPLCEGSLIRQRGMTVEYCAMGALAKAVGATDEDLNASDACGHDLYKRFAIPLALAFGIDSYETFSDFMEVNDNAKNPIERTEAMTKHIESLGVLTVDSEFEVLHTH